MGYRMEETASEDVKLALMFGQAPLWLFIMVVDTWISFIMVLTFRRIHAVLNPGANSPTTLGSNTDTQSSTTTHPSKVQHIDVHREGRILVLLLTVTVTCDALALLFLVMGEVITPLRPYKEEVTQVAASWVGIHYVVGVYFLARFKASMLVRESTPEDVYKRQGGSA
ncbi:hypothetical protein HK104_003788, partial [Borealophlyctis nickersoniae]